MLRAGVTHSKEPGDLLFSPDGISSRSDDGLVSRSYLARHSGYGMWIRSVTLGCLRRKNFVADGFKGGS